MVDSADDLDDIDAIRNELEISAASDLSPMARTAPGADGWAPCRRGTL